MARIKKPSQASPHRIAEASQPTNYDEVPVVFSLEKLQSGKYCFSTAQKPQKLALISSIFKRRTMTWKDINNAGRHGLGSEKLPRDQIKAPMPDFITDDVSHFLALRFDGKRPMVGYKQKNFFYILWLDCNFSLYDHGS